MRVEVVEVVKGGVCVVLIAQLTRVQKREAVEDASREAALALNTFEGQTQCVKDRLPVAGCAAPPLDQREILARDNDPRVRVGVAGMAG